MKQNNDSKDNYQTTPKTRELMKNHPNLKSAPSVCPSNTGEEPGIFAKQGSSYGEDNKCSPNNNIFWEERGNHLSSKGD